MEFDGKSKPIVFFQSLDSSTHWKMFVLVNNNCFGNTAKFTKTMQPAQHKKLIVLRNFWTKIKLDEPRWVVTKWQVHGTHVRLMNNPQEQCGFTSSQFGFRLFTCQYVKWYRTCDKFKKRHGGCCVHFPFLGMARKRSEVRLQQIE